MTWLSCVGLYFLAGIVVTTILCILEPPEDDEILNVSVAIFIWPLLVLPFGPVLFANLIRTLTGMGK